MKVEHLFSTPLYNGKFKKHEEYKSKLLPLLYKDIKEAKDKNRHDNLWKCNSYQTWLWGNGQEELMTEMFTYVDEYLIELGYPKFNYRIQESWFNMYGPNQYQEEHEHLPMLFSGLYTMQFDPEWHTGTSFKNKYPEMAAIHRIHKIFPQNYEGGYIDRNVELEEGHIYIFPSNARHCVHPQPAKLDPDNYRITFTFNVST